MENKYRSIILRFLRKPMPKQSARFTIGDVAVLDPGGFGVIPASELKNMVKNKKTINSYQTKEIKQYEKNILIEAITQVRGGFKPLKGCLAVEIEFMYKHPIGMKAAHKRHIRAGGKILKTTRPDVTDNLNKPVMDALQGRFYKEDCIIATSKSTKVYGLKNMITLKISEISIFIS